MKRICTIALVLVLSVCLLTGCFGRKDNNTTTVPSTTVAPTQAPTSRPTTQPTVRPDGTMPGMDDMIPGTDDTIDPTNGANQDAGDARGRAMPSKY